MRTVTAMPIKGLMASYLSASYIFAKALYKTNVLHFPSDASPSHWLRLSWCRERLARFLDLDNASDTLRWATESTGD